MSQSTLNDRTSQLDHYISQQMKKTGAQVKMIDLFTVCMTLFAGILGTLFLLAIIDAWIVELGPSGRWISLIGLLSGSLIYFGVRVFPLLTKKINPVYAAKVVEESQPSIKNSLINYIILRRSKDKVSRSVVNAIGSRAANEISGVAVENTVDKSHTIRIAIALTALVIVFGVYKIFSPKDPFQTFARVIAPSSDIAKPARVRITNVQPGDTSVYFGEQLTITADVDGKIAAGDIRLVYSTNDGQIVDAEIPMTSESRAGRFTAILRSGITGIEHSLRYRIRAGDGKTGDYIVSLKSTPTLTVESITYQPPEYTRLPTRTVEGISDIEEVEGTRVSLTAVSNTDLQSAYVELLRRNPNNELFRVVSNVSMEIVDSRRASCHFGLSLDSTREYQKYTHYCLRFVTTDNQRNVPVAVYPIRIISDLAPEIQIVDPVDDKISIPANSMARFNVRASDPDFQISRVQIHGFHSGSPLLQQDLELGDQDRESQVEAKFEFWPKKLALQAGETAIVSFSAADNRASTVSGAPDPNVTMTENVVITVIEPTENPPQDQSEGDQPSDETGEQESSQSDEQGGQKQGGQKQGGQKQGGQKQGGQDNTGEQSGGEKGSEQNDTNQQSGGEQKAGQQSGGQPQKQEDSNQSGSKSDQNQSDSGDQSNAEKSQSQSGNAANPDQAKESQSDQKSGGQSSGQAGDQSNDSGEKGASSGSSSESSGDPSQQSAGQASNSSDQASGNQSGDNASASTSGGQQSGNPSGESSPLSEDAHDGEVFERIMKYQERQQQNNDSSTPSAGDATSQPPTGEDPGDQNSGDQKSGDQKSGDQKSGDQKSGDQKSGDQKSGDQKSGDQTSGDQTSGDQKSADQKSESGDKASDGTQSGGDQSQSDQAQESSSQSKQTGSDQKSGQKSGQQSGQQSDQQAGQESGQKSGQSSGEQSSQEKSAGSKSGEQQQNNSQSAGGQDKQQSSASSSKSNQESQQKSGDQENSDQQAGSAAMDEGTSDSKAEQTGSSEQGNQSGDTEQNDQGGASSESQAASQNQSSENESSKGGGSQAEDEKQSQSQGGGGQSEKQSDSGSASDKQGSQSKSGDQQPGSNQGDQPGDSGKSGDQAGGQSSPDSKNPGSSSDSDQQSEKKGAGKSEGSSSKSDQQSDGSSQSQSKSGSGKSGSSQSQSDNQQDSAKSDSSKSDGSKSNSQESSSKSTQASKSGQSGGSSQDGNKNQSGSKSASDPSAAGAQPGAGASDAGAATDGSSPIKDSNQGAGSEADKANLDYANKATDMVLSYLENQKVTPDPQLLDELNWTEDDLKDFLKRWRELKKKGELGDRDDRANMDQSLKSLGLAPPINEKRTIDVQRDRQHGFSEDGRVVKPPADLADKFRAFQKRRNRAKKR